MSDTHKIMKGDTRTPIGRVLTQGGQPVDLTGLTVKWIGYKADGTSWFAERTDGITAQPTTAFTVDTTDKWVIANGHKARIGDQLLLTTSSALPAGLATSTRYFVRDVTPNKFKVSLLPDGSVVDITGSGTGTHSFTIVGSVQGDLQTADVATATGLKGNKLWFRVYDGSEYDTFPAEDEAIVVVIEEVG